MRVLRQLWAARTARERAMIALMLLLAVGVVGWAGVIKPMGRWSEAAAARRVAAAQRLAEVTVLVQQVSPARQVAGGDVETALAAAARDLGVTMTSQREDGAGASRVVMERVSPAAFFAWAQRLENQAITVDNLTATKVGDGAVRIEAVLRRGS